MYDIESNIKTMPPTIMEANQFRETEISAPQIPIMLKWEEHEKRNTEKREREKTIICARDAKGLKDESICKYNEWKTKTKPEEEVEKNQTETYQLMQILVRRR